MAVPATQVPATQDIQCRLSQRLALHPVPGSEMVVYLDLPGPAVNGAALAGGVPMAFFGRAQPVFWLPILAKYPCLRFVLVEEESYVIAIRHEELKMPRRSYFDRYHEFVLALAEVRLVSSPARRRWCSCVTRMLAGAQYTVGLQFLRSHDVLYLASMNPDLRPDACPASDPTEWAPDFYPALKINNGSRIEEMMQAPGAFDNKQLLRLSTLDWEYVVDYRHFLYPPVRVNTTLCYEAHRVGIPAFGAYVDDDSDRETLPAGAPVHWVGGPWVGGVWCERCFLRANSPDVSFAVMMAVVAQVRCRLFAQQRPWSLMLGVLVCWRLDGQVNIQIYDAETLDRKLCFGHITSIKHMDQEWRAGRLDDRALQIDFDVLRLCGAWDNTNPASFPALAHGVFLKRYRDIELEPPLELPWMYYWVKYMSSPEPQPNPDDPEFPPVPSAFEYATPATPPTQLLAYIPTSALGFPTTPDSDF